MTLDTIVALAAVLIAAYQIMPPARRLDLSLRFGVLDLWLLIAGMTVVLYLQFYSLFSAIGLSPHLGLSRWKLTPGRASFVVVLVLAILVWLHLRLARLSPSRILKFRRLVEELIWSKNFPELFMLLENNLDRLVKIVEDRLPLSRLRRLCLEPQYRLPSFEEALGIKEVRKETRVGLRVRKAARRLRPIARFLLPDRSGASGTARDLRHRLLTSREFAASVARTRPYFGLQVLRDDVRENEDFLRNYFRALLTEPSSVLHYEISNNYNTEKGWYVVPQSNRLLHFFFADAHVAERYSIWRPIGETVIEELNRLSMTPGEDPYNLAPVEDVENDLLLRESALFSGTFLFDLMVTQALRQGIKWHMWLYYFPYFTKRVVRNYSPAQDSIASRAEFPTRYSRLLYFNIFSRMRGWISAVERVPKDQPNVILRSYSPENENGNIPKSAIIALGSCLNDLLAGQKIELPFKDSVLEMVYELYFDLRKMDADNYAKVLLSVLKDSALKHRADIRRAFDSFDKTPHKLHHPDHLKEFAALLNL